MPEPTVESPPGSGRAAARLLEEGLRTNPSSIHPSIKRACHHLAQAGLQAEGLGSDPEIEALALNAVAAGYVIGRLQLLGTVRPGRALGFEDTETGARTLLERQRGLDTAQLHRTIGPDVRRLQTELSWWTALKAAASDRSTVRRLTYVGFAAGFGLAIVEQDMVQTQAQDASREVAIDGR